MDTKPVVVEIAMEVALPYSFLDTIFKKFGPEKARECAMSTSVGGIGPLLRERIFSQGDAGVDVIGVTLLYNSVWVQAWHEWGQINLQKHPIGKELRAMLIPTDLGFKITFFDGKETDVEVWALDYGRVRVYFLSVPEINDVVYPGPKDAPHNTENAFSWSHECRLKQSWLVGRGALILSKKLNRKPNVVVLSETPTFFGHHQLVKDELQKDSFFSDTKYIFNDHTPLEYAHPLWDTHTLDMIHLNPDTYLKTPAWNASKKILDVTSLLVSQCDAVFGVAKKHGDVMKAMPSLKNYADKIQYITNGVRREDWQTPEFKDPNPLTNSDLFQIKQREKEKLLDWVWRHCQLWPSWAKESAQRRIILWTRRITPYKRLDLLVKMLQNPDQRKKFLELNIVMLIGGRIHQQDNHAQDIVYSLLELLEKEKELQKRIVPVDNFNVWEAPQLFRGTDGAIMLADDTREASATGFMKAQMNGAAILATPDGAVPEFVYFFPKNQEPAPANANGFYIPYVNGEPTPQGLLEALTQFDQALAVDSTRANIIRNAIAVTNQLDVARTVKEMESLYNSVLSNSTAALPQR